MKYIEISWLYGLILIPFVAVLLPVVIQPITTCKSKWLAICVSMPNFHTAARPVTPSLASLSANSFRYRDVNADPRTSLTPKRTRWSVDALHEKKPDVTHQLALLWFSLFCSSYLATSYPSFISNVSSVTLNPFKIYVTLSSDFSPQFLHSFRQELILVNDVFPQRHLRLKVL